MKAPDPTATSLDGYPLVLTVAHLQEIYGKSAQGIERLVRKGSGIPQPMFDRPMRWSREEVAAHLSGKRLMNSTSQFKHRMSA